jgi:hypothetical protein
MLRLKNDTDRQRRRCLGAMPPNFTLLDPTLPDVARLVTAMVQAREAVGRRSWSHPMESTTEKWWDRPGNARAVRLAQAPVRRRVVRSTFLSAVSATT